MAIRFEELPPRTQATVIAALILVLVGVVFWYFVWPLGVERSALASEVGGLEAQNSRNRAFESQHAEYRKKIVESQHELNLLGSIVPEQPDVDGLIRATHQAEVSSGIHIRSLTAQPMVPRALYTELPFKMKADGTYQGLLDFFSRMAAGQRIVNVSGLSLSAATAGGGYQIQPGETVTADFVLASFYNGPKSNTLVRK